MAEYTIIYANHKESLITLVNSGMEKGWKPLGGAIVIPAPEDEQDFYPLYLKSSDGTIVETEKQYRRTSFWYQTMILESTNE